MVSINLSKILLKVRCDEKYILGFLCEVESFIVIEKCWIFKERLKKLVWSVEGNRKWL